MRPRRRAHADKKTKTFLSAIVCHGGIEMIFFSYIRIYPLIRLFRRFALRRQNKEHSKRGTDKELIKLSKKRILKG